MKIGIVSMQRVINYGSYLQSYALKSILQEIGCDVYFVDIKSGKKIVEKKAYVSNNKKIDKFFIKRIEHVLFEKKRRKSFHEIYFYALGVNETTKENNCDGIIIGSDEVFNCMQPSRWGFSTQLFGDTVVPSASYAASCGYTSFRGVEELGITTDIRNALNKMLSISVRDSNTRDFVYKITGRTAEEHLDPVLIYSWNDIERCSKRLKNYILVYAYDNRINNLDEIATIRKFAKDHNKTLVSCGVYQRWCDKNIHCSPLELLSYFDGADYVVTDTFHGTVISIKRNKKFATIIRDSNRNKISDLLQRFGLECREVKSITDLSGIITENIDYQRVNDIVAYERDRSITYLKDFIRNVQEVKYDQR